MQIHLQIERVEKENQVSALEIFKLDILELSSNDGSSLEIRSLLLDESRWQESAVDSGKLQTTRATQQTLRCQRHNTLQCYKTGQLRIFQLANSSQQTWDKLRKIKAIVVEVQSDTGQQWQRKGSLQTVWGC